MRIVVEKTAGAIETAARGRFSSVPHSERGATDHRADAPYANTPFPWPNADRYRGICRTASTPLPSPEVIIARVEDESPGSSAGGSSRLHEREYGFSFGKFQCFLFFFRILWH